MNKDLTEIVVILDKSGSMGDIKDDTIGGFNSFLKEQKAAADGKARLTLVQFSTQVNTTVDSLDITEVEPLTDKTYRPGGGTSLLDAIGQTIDRLEDKYTDEEDVSKIPGKVIFAIITDGEENTSTTYAKSRVAKMIKHQTNRHGWEIVFLGANLDAVEEGDGLGIRASNSLNFAPNSKGVQDSFAVLSSATSMYRSSGQATYDIAGTSLADMNKDK